MENRKTQIIDLASALIRKKGYSTFSYDEISKHFGVTKASIYYHFEKKEDLGLAVLDQLYRALVDFRSVIQRSPLSVEEKLVRYCAEQSKRFAQYDICPLSSLQADYESLPESMKIKIKEVSEFELSMIEDIVAEGTEDPAVNTRALAITILAATKGALQYNRAMHGNFMPDILHGIHLLLNTNK